MPVNNVFKTSGHFLAKATALPVQLSTAIPIWANNNNFNVEDTTATHIPNPRWAWIREAMRLSIIFEDADATVLTTLRAQQGRNAGRRCIGN